jgi:glycine/D-amino acid oxidase-like deaminating enzyme
MKVAVVGAGVLGASLTFHLAQRGADVVHVEQGDVGGGTSSRGAGLVSEGMWHPTSLALVRRSIELLHELSRIGREMGSPFRFAPTGSSTLVPARLEAQARALAAAQAKAGAEVELLAPGEARGLPRHEGMRLDDVELVIRYPRDGWARPRMFADTMTIGAAMQGAQRVRGRARLLPGGALEVDGERVACDAVALACGVGTRAVLREAGLDAPLQAYRTQALKLHDPRGAEVPIVHDAVQGFYLRPGSPAHLVAGNGTTTTPEDPLMWRREADPSFTEKTLRRLKHRFPALRTEARFDAWAGIDAATPDRLLLAGPHPAQPDVWLLAGGNGHGFMRAPAAGESLAAMMMGETPEVDLSAYAPSRFASMSDDFQIREGYSIEAPGFM